jgi:phage-related protein
MPSIGPRCHELHVRDKGHNWPIVYRLDSDAILIVEVFAKATIQPPRNIIANCQRRLKLSDRVAVEDRE